MPGRFAQVSGKTDYRDATGIIFDDGARLRQAAVQGLGLVHFWHHIVRDDLQAGRLTTVLDDHLAPVPGFYLYYPSRDVSPAMSVFSDALVEHCRR